MDKKVSKKKGILYLIKWQGYGNKYNTWESINNLEDVIHLIEEFEAKLKDDENQKANINIPFVVKYIKKKNNLLHKIKDKGTII